MVEVHPPNENWLSSGSRCGGCDGCDGGVCGFVKQVPMIENVSGVFIYKAYQYIHNFKFL
jgi:hypothetical protein